MVPVRLAPVALAVLVLAAAQAAAAKEEEGAPPPCEPLEALGAWGSWSRWSRCVQGRTSKQTKPALAIHDIMSFLARVNRSLNSSLCLVSKGYEYRRRRCYRARGRDRPAGMGWREFGRKSG